MCWRGLSRIFSFSIFISLLLQTLPHPSFHHPFLSFYLSLCLSVSVTLCLFVRLSLPFALTNHPIISACFCYFPLTPLPYVCGCSIASSKFIINLFPTVFNSCFLFVPSRHPAQSGTKEERCSAQMGKPPQ